MFKKYEFLVEMKKKYDSHEKYSNKKLAAEYCMPLCYWGGVKSAEFTSKPVDMGVEKIAVSLAAITNSKINKWNDIYSWQAVVAIIDFKKNFLFKWIRTLRS